ncbi:PQQ-binding-like beta-propeller repeat protein [Edaphobacter modestus]|uniref:PQQ enzyme-like repeat protein n=1 Tax=Edaphobacter modestus TaxID=388466 RepID=A0A4Q7Z0Y1_9BACT|nr:PQQ-binding-like beta-propeller repeat protein [Edaphobacter modestus]RZU43504.1 PQQ enzyme-like repeat protein [Edaphobacter modestus]
MTSFLKMLVACSGLIACALLASCGGSSKPPADFSLSSAPGSITLAPGGPPQQISVNAVPANGFTDMVSVAITGLPSGVTAQPSSLMLTPGTAQNIAVSAAPSAAAGSATLTLTGTSGAISHTSAVTATIAPPPPPDFSLSVAPASLTITAGASGSPVSVTANPLNSFAGNVTVSIAGLPAGVTANPATVGLTPGTSQSTTLSATPTTPPAVSTLTFTGTSGGLTHNAVLALNVLGATTTIAPDVTTFHYDLSRSGLNAKETILTPANVNSTQFGKVGFYSMDGKVDAQPLYLANVAMGGKFHNVIYAASEHGSMYAFDADDGSQLWKVSLLGSGETPSDDHRCSQISPEIGISATPVIDRKQGANGTIFAVATSKDANGGYHQRLHALDLTTGSEIGSPTEVTATYPGTGDNSQNGNVIFDPAQYAERAALLLLNGNIYTAWTSHCDQGLYTGWIIAYSESTLQQTQLLNVTPNGSRGSIWMSGAGMAADSNGFIYLLDADGTFDTTLDMNGFPSKGDYGNAILKLSTANGKLTVADYFTMYNTQSLSVQDVDLGSGGPLLLPDQIDSQGTVHRLIVGAGKDRNIYLADRDNLGKFNPATNPMDNNIYQELPGANLGPAYSSAAYFNGVLYYAADGDALKAYPMTNAKMATTPSSVSPTKFSHPGPTPTISANGVQNGIVWALDSSVGRLAILHAYDPANLAHELYNSSQAPNGRDSFGNGNKFITPMVVNGKVYVGTPTGVAVFGLLSP